MAALLAARPSVAGHWSAAWLWGLLQSRPRTLHVTYPRRGRSWRTPLTMNVFVAGQELDAYWEDAHFEVELDTYETHGSRLSFEDDRVRDDDFLPAGLDTTRVTEARLDREPGAVIDSLREHLARRAGARPGI